MHKADKIKLYQKVEGAIEIVRSANEELIRLSQRLGRAIPKIYLLDLHSTIVRNWLDDYKKAKVSVEIADKELMKALQEEKLETKERKGDHLSSGYLTLAREYMHQKIRYEAKIETIEDILDGIVEEINEDALIKPFIKKEKEARPEPSKECDLDVWMFQ